MRARLMLAGLVAGLVTIVGVPTDAQTPGTSSERKLELTFDGNGYATLIAENVTVSEVFAAWARVGGTKILNAEKLPAGRISVQFDKTPELELVKSLVRQSKAQNAGEIVVPRLLGAPVTPSRLATINILPTSSPTTSYTGTASSVTSTYPQGTADDPTEMSPVMPPIGGGPAQQQPPPQPNPASRGAGPGIPVVPVGGPGTVGRGGTPLPGAGRGNR